MKKQRIMTDIISLCIIAFVLLIPLPSCSTQEYNTLKEYFGYLEAECEDLERQLTSQEEEIATMSYEIEYYEMLCEKFKLLNYSQAYPFIEDFAYLSSQDKLLHTDYFCQKSGNLSLQLVKCEDYPNYDFCDACIGEYLLDPQTKLYHDTWSLCAPHATSDYKTISFNYIIASEENAKGNGYKPCPSCVDI